MGICGEQILAAWRAKELLRDLLRLTFKHARTRPTAKRSPPPCTASTPTSPTTPTCPNSLPSPKPLKHWWSGIETYITTGITNAASEGNNRVIKLEARKAYGFRNRHNQRLRSHCATSQ
jgi:transposase